MKPPRCCRDDPGIGTVADVIVVGGRAAGAATAMLLARAGMRVIVIERADLGADTISTHALMRPGVMQLHRWGLLDAVVAAGTPPVRTTTFHYGDEALRLPVKPGDGIDALYAPRRTVLDRILSEAATAAGADVRHGARVTGVNRRVDGRVSGVDVVDRNGHHGRLTAGLVVGADGRSSIVARAVGAQPTHLATTAAAYVYAHVPGFAADGYDWYFRPGRTAGVIPTNGGDSCVFVGLPPERFEAEVRHRVAGGFIDVLTELDPGVAAVVADAGDVRFHLFPGAPGFLRSAHGPGWALVGDAGYFKDPATAHGITDALRDAELLATALASAADGGSETDALAGYERERDLQSLRTFEVTSAIAGFGWDLEQLRAMHLALSTEMSLEADALRRLDGVLALS